MLHIVAENKTTQFFKDVGEQNCVISEAYRWRWSVFFQRIRADLGLACVQAANLCSQVVSNSHRRSARAPVKDPIPDHLDRHDPAIRDLSTCPCPRLRLF